MRTIIAPDRVLTDDEFQKELQPIVTLITENGHELVFGWEEKPEWFIFVKVPTTNPELRAQQVIEEVTLVGLLLQLEKKPTMHQVSVIGCNLEKLAGPLQKVSYFINNENFNYRTFFH